MKSSTFITFFVIKSCSKSTTKRFFDLQNLQVCVWVHNAFKISQESLTYITHIYIYAYIYIYYMGLPCIALTFPLAYARGCFGLCNWLSWWCLEPSINNLPPVCPSILPRMFTTQCAWLLWMYKYLTILFAVIQKHFYIRPFYSDMWISIQSHKLSF